MAYDTLTAMCSPEGFTPDPQVGWEMRPVNISFDLETGETLRKDKWVWNQDGYDFTYFPEGPEQDSRLLLQVSLPRVLTGSNVEPWAPGDDCDAVGAGLRIGQEVHRRLDWQEVPWIADWDVNRLDATANYKLASHSHVMSVLSALRGRRIPHHRKSAYTGETGTVMWGGKVRRYVVYSKEIEQREKGYGKEAAAKAVGILRAEARVQKSRYVRRLLKSLVGEPVTVRKVLAADMVKPVSAIILGHLEGTVSETIGGLVMANSPALEDMVKDLGVDQAARVLGMHFMYQARGEEWLRHVYGDRSNFYRTMKRLKDLGLDPRTVDLGLGKQLRMLDSVEISQRALRPQDDDAPG